MLVHIEAHGSEGEVDHADLIATLVELTEADVARDVPPAVPLLGEILVEQGAVSAADVAAAVHEQEQAGQALVGEILVARGATTNAAIKEALEAQQDVRAGNASAGNVSDGASSPPGSSNIMFDTTRRGQQALHGQHRRQTLRPRQ